MKIRTLFSLFVVSSILIIASCSKDPGTGTITLQLNHSVAGEPVEIEQLKYISQAGHTYSVVNLKYYLSEIKLSGNEGNSVAYSKIHLRDIHDPSTQEITINDAPDGVYNSIEFIFGLNEVVNIDGGLENTVENINMEWPIPGDQGYHYMKFEGRYDSLNTGTIRSFNVHTGATMGNQNYFRVTLPLSSINVESNSWMIDLNMDLHEWLHNPMIFDFVGHERIMMNQNAQEILKANGKTVFSIYDVHKI
jgi:hypothetical protein